LLIVNTGVESLGRAQVVFCQRILRDEVLLLDAKIRIACIDPLRGRPTAMPQTIHEQLAARIQPAAPSQETCA
jgi:acyl-CoA thioester hydrolase